MVRCHAPCCIEGSTCFSMGTSIVRYRGDFNARFFLLNTPVHTKLHCSLTFTAFPSIWGPEIHRLVVYLRTVPAKKNLAVFELSGEPKDLRGKKLHRLPQSSLPGRNTQWPSSRIKWSQSKYGAISLTSTRIEPKLGCWNRFFQKRLRHRFWRHRFPASNWSSLPSNSFIAPAQLEAGQMVGTSLTLEGRDSHWKRNLRATKLPRLNLTSHIYVCVNR